MILIDNTVLFNFSLSDVVPLLRAFCHDRGMVTQAVYDEYRAGIEKQYFKQTDLSWFQITDCTDAREQQLFQRYHVRFGAGEVSSLAIASIRGHSLLTDDMSARKEAQRTGITVSGSLGVLITMIHKGHLSVQQGNSILQAFISAGYFSPVDRLDNLVSMVIRHSATRHHHRPLPHHPSAR